jgi:hypothetical protein
MPRLGYDHFLLNPFQFVIHLSFYYSTPYSVRCWQRRNISPPHPQRRNYVIVWFFCWFLKECVMLLLVTLNYFSRFLFRIFCLRGIPCDFIPSWSSVVTDTCLFSVQMTECELWKRIFKDSLCISFSWKKVMMFWLQVPGWRPHSLRCLLVVNFGAKWVAQ